jgi:hypothetical protein
MTIMPNRSRRNVGLTEMRHVVKQLEVDLFVRVMVRKSTTKGLTEEVAYEMSRLGLLVVQQIVHVSLKGHS